MVVGRGDRHRGCLPVLSRGLGGSRSVLGLCGSHICARICEGVVRRTDWMVGGGGEKGKGCAFWRACACSRGEVTHMRMCMCLLARACVPLGRRLHM